MKLFLLKEYNHCRSVADYRGRTLYLDGDTVGCETPQFFAGAQDLRISLNGGAPLPPRTTNLT